MIWFIYINNFYVFENKKDNLNREIVNIKKFNDFYAIKTNTKLLGDRLIWYKQDSFRRNREWFVYRIFIKFKISELELWNNDNVKWKIQFDKVGKISYFEFLVWENFILKWNTDTKDNSKILLQYKSFERNEKYKTKLINQDDLELDFFFTKLLPYKDLKINEENIIEMTTPLFIKNNQIKISDLRVRRTDINEYRISQSIAWINTSIKLKYDTNNKLIEESNPFFTMKLITDQAEIDKVTNIIENKKQKEIKNTDNKTKEIDIETKVDNIEETIKQIENKEVIKVKCDLLK